MITLRETMLDGIHKAEAEGFAKSLWIIFT